jgi:hypothetical protein
MSTNLKIISDLRNFIALSTIDSELKKVFTTSEKAFNRRRKLPFERIVSLLLNFFKKSYDIEIADFFSQLGSMEQKASKSAFSQQRLKISSYFFNCLNLILAESFYIHYQEAVERWMGLKVIAIDGSTSYLIDTEEVTKHFGTHDNQRGSVTLGRILCAFDVLNKIVIKAGMYPIHLSEQKIAIQWLDAYKPDMLLIYDRAYPGFASIFQHESREQPQPFVMRCAIGFNKAVIDFVKSGQNDAIGTFTADKRARRDLKEQGFIVKIGTKIPVRFVRVVLDDGTVEVLVTNLLNQQKYPYSEFKALYFKRWGIETKFDIFKNKLQLEAFSGQKVETILQDFYITVFLANLQEIISKASKPAVDQVSARRKYDYQINKNIAIGLMKNRIIGLFLFENPEHILVTLQKLFAQHLEPIRPGRKYPRIRKLKRRAGKYKTLTNYKRAI